MAIYLWDMSGGSNTFIFVKANKDHVFLNSDTYFELTKDNDTEISKISTMLMSLSSVGTYSGFYCVSYHLLC